jgi:membrane protease YdiL (CAAX protease family)
VIAVARPDGVVQGGRTAGRDGGSRHDFLRLVVLVAGLAAAVALRAGGQGLFPAEGLAIGLAFGAVLAALALATWRWERPRVAGIVIRLGAGLVAGLVLVVIAAAIRPEALPSLRPAAPFVPWVAVTVLVASSEEAVFRGALFGTLDRRSGPLVALAVTTVVFAAMHVPFYGPSAIPLDVAVGLVLGGLRLATRGVAAPIAAHVTADLATWWL